MGRRAALALLYFAAIVLGIGSAFFWLTRVSMTGVDAGVWRANLLAGSRDADAYTRARIALAAVLALDRSETIYFTADRDAAGDTLHANCSYEVAGLPPPARWWSITAYAADHFLFDHPARRYSISGESTRLDAAGRFRAVVGPVDPGQADTQWMSTSGTGALRLTLRLYGAADSVQKNPAAWPAPSVTRLGACR